MVALPALAMTVVMAVSVTRATRSLEAVQELATLCEANEKEASPRKQLMRLNEMHVYIDELYREQHEKIENATQIQ
jgi:hypothetical protein